MNARTEPKWLRPAVDYGPLVAFFLAYVSQGLLAATAVLMVTTLVMLGISLAYTRRIAVMPLVTAGVVGVFGGLTLWLQDDTFIKMKPTIITLVMGTVLLAGLARGKVLLKHVLGHALPMTETGWRRLTLRFGLFFLAMAVVNELVWRTQSTDFWVSFKVFGIMGLTFLFVLTQAPLINRHRLDEGAGAPND